jgi:hypothetical protein
MDSAAYDGPRIVDLGSFTELTQGLDGKAQDTAESRGSKTH